MYGPIIQGDGVLLRPFKSDDAKDLIAMMADPVVNQYLVVQNPPNHTMEREWLEKRAADPNSVSWAIEVNKRCVGTVSFDHIDWRNGSATVGIFIGATQLWGKGFASNVAQLLAHYAFMSLPLRKVKSGFLEPNTASGRLQASIGLKEVGRWKADTFRNGVWVDHVLTEVTREEWLCLKTQS